MKTTKQLSLEHEAILRGLEILKAAATRWLRDPLASDEDCRLLLDFLKTFADRCHHGKEETALFPKLMQLGGTVDGGPFGVLLYEHDRGRQLIRNMEKALANADPAAFELHAEKYADLLEDHIAKEDNILFARADSLLTREDDEALMRRFDEIEHEMGKETHERFHRILDQLAARYLSKPAKAS